MRGSYQMAADDGRTFEVEIPEFSLHAGCDETVELGGRKFPLIPAFALGDSHISQ
jgi:hypothetical protein